MKKKSWITLVFVFTFAVSLFGIFNAATVSGAKPITLSIANFFPPMAFVERIQVENWVKDIEAATGGAVKFNRYPGQTLLKSVETYDGVVAGTADLAIWVPSYTRGRFPVIEGLEIVGIYFGSCQATTAVALEGLEKFKPKELSDTKLMYIYSVGPGSLYSKKKVTSLDDLKGMRIRATGPTARSIEVLGAIPVAMPMPDVYEALSKGVIEANLAPPEVLKTFKHAELTKYITVFPPVYNSLQGCVMNLKKWNSLPKNVQAAFEKVNEDWSMKAAAIWDEQMKVNGIDYGIKEHGMEISRLPEADFNKALELMQPLLDEYIAKMNAKGLPGKEIIDFVKEKAAKYSKMYPPGY